MQRPVNDMKLSIGEPAPYFSLSGTDGKIHNIADYRDGKGLLVIFTCNHCPYAQAYEQRICELARDFQPLGIAFITVCSNDGSDFPEDSFERMVEKSRSMGFPFPYLHDVEQQVAKAYDAACTPEAFLFDSEFKLTYHGRIDDNFQNPELVSSNDLRLALDAVVEGQTPEMQRTPCIGCSIKWRR